MKKIIGLVLCLCVLCSVASAGIDTSWNTIAEPHGNLKFNVDVGTREAPDYYPLQVKLDVPIKTADGNGKRQVTILKNVGTNRPTPFVFSTMEGLKEVYQALPVFAQGAFKEAVLAGINEDTSVE